MKHENYTFKLSRIVGSRRGVETLHEHVTPVASWEYIKNGPKMFIIKHSCAFLQKTQILLISFSIFLYVKLIFLLYCVFIKIMNVCIKVEI